MMMDMSPIIEIISSLGFPIAACIYMAYINNKQSERHTEEIGELRKVVEANTLTVQRLVDKIDKISSGGDPKNE